MNSKRVFAIGDIHGCFLALDTLLETIRPTQQDTVVVLGDFIDQGRETQQVIDRLIQLAGECRLIHLIGNHEELCLDALQDTQSLNYWMNCGGVSTLNSYRFGGMMKDIPDEHIDFIRSGLDYYEDDSYIFCHTSPDTDVPLRENSPCALRWQLLNPETVEPHPSGKTLIVGHTEQLNGEVLDLQFIRCIDTACWRYGWLTAMEVHTGEIWQAQRFGVLREPGDEKVGPIGTRDLMIA